MAKYVLAYRGGGMAATEEEQNAAMAAWGAFLGNLGAAVVDQGNPFSGSKSIAADGTVGDSGTAGLTGYSILNADSLDAAVGLTKDCPIFANGGSVDVYEAIEM
jgi:hypothetical protein